MATPTATGFGFGKLDQDILQLKVDGKEYELLSDGKVMLGTAEITDVAELAKIDKQAAKAAKEFIKAKPITEQSEVVIRLIENNAAKTEYKALDAILQESKALEAKLTALPVDKVLKEEQLKEIRNILAKTPEAENALSVASYHILNGKKIMVDGKEVALLDRTGLDKAVKKLQTSAEELAKLAEKGSATEADVRKLLLSTPDLKEVVSPELKGVLKKIKGTHANPDVTSIDFDALVSTVESEIKTHTVEIENLASKVLSAQDKVATATRWEIATAQKTLDREVKALSDYTSKHAEFKPHMDAALKAKLGTDELKTLSEVKGVNIVLTDLAKTAEKAEGKASGNFFKDIFVVSEKLTDKRTAKAIEKGASAEELEKIGARLNKTRWGSVAAGAVVAVALIAKVTSSKGKHQTALDTARAQAPEPEMAPAR